MPRSPGTQRENPKQIWTQTPPISRSHIFAPLHFRDRICPLPCPCRTSRQFKRQRKKKDAESDQIGTNGNVQTYDNVCFAEIKSPRSTLDFSTRGLHLRRILGLRARVVRDISWTYKYAAGAKEPTTYQLPGGIMSIGHPPLVVYPMNTMIPVNPRVKDCNRILLSNSIESSISLNQIEKHRVFTGTSGAVCRRSALPERGAPPPYSTAERSPHPLLNTCTHANFGRKFPRLAAIAATA